MLFSLLMMVAAGAAATDTRSEISDSARTGLRDAGVSEPIAQKVVSSKALTESQRASLTEEQNSRIESVRSSITAGTIGAGAGTAIVGGLLVVFFVMSLVGGLLSYSLVMKKRILQCNTCGAVIAAS